MTPVVCRASCVDFGVAGSCVVYCWCVGTGFCVVGWCGVGVRGSDVVGYAVYVDVVSCDVVGGYVLGCYFVGWAVLGGCGLCGNCVDGCGVGVWSLDDDVVAYFVAGMICVCGRYGGVG